MRHSIAMLATEGPAGAAEDVFSVQFQWWTFANTSSSLKGNDGVNLSSIAFSASLLGFRVTLGLHWGYIRFKLEGLWERHAIKKVERPGGWTREPSPP
jgi:hypothetical protein